MKTIKDQHILIVDTDAHFREELYNFLLSAGYEKVDSTENFDKALEKIRQVAYNVVVVDAGSPLMEGLKFAKSIAKLNPQMRIILMIEAEDGQKWNGKGGRTGEFQTDEFPFVIKTTFARTLLHVLSKLSKVENRPGLHDN